MSTEENKTIVMQFFEEGPSKGNLIDADKLLSPDFAMHTPLPASPGIKGIHEVTHKGDFMGLPATGKPITMTGIEIFRIENGKIVELWG